VVYVSVNIWQNSALAAIQVLPVEPPVLSNHLPFPVLNEKRSVPCQDRVPSTLSHLCPSPPLCVRISGLVFVSILPKTFLYHPSLFFFRRLKITSPQFLVTFYPKAQLVAPPFDEACPRPPRLPKFFRHFPYTAHQTPGGGNFLNFSRLPLKRPSSWFGVSNAFPHQILLTG